MLASPRLAFHVPLATLLLLVVGALVPAAAATPTVAPSAHDLTTASPGVVGTVATRSRSACDGPRREPGGADPWGGCWPGPRNTGVRASLTLRQVDGDRTITRRGKVVRGLDVDGCINVAAVGVTITNSRAKCIRLVSNSPARYCHYGEPAAIRRLTECTVVRGLSDDSNPRTNNPRLVVRRSEIDCRGEPGDTGTAIGDRNINVIRVDIRRCENGFDADSYMTIRHSYIHDLYNSTEGDPHTDGLQSAVGTRLRLVHNVFFGFTGACQYPNDGSCNGTAAINIGGQSDRATSRRTVLRRNLVAGGAYTVYCPMQPPRRFRIVQNRFSEVYSPRVGEYGPMTDCHGDGVILRGNRRVHY